MEHSKPEAVVDYSLTPKPSSVTEKYIVFELKEMWGHTTFRVVADDTKVGLSFGPTSLKEIPLAFVRPGREEVAEEVPAGSISVEELQYCMQELVKLMKLARETYRGEGF